MRGREQTVYAERSRAGYVQATNRALLVGIDMRHVRVMRAHAVLLVVIVCSSIAGAETQKQKKQPGDESAFKTRKRVCGLVLAKVPKVMACKLRVIDGVEFEPPTDVLKQWRDAPSSETDPKVTAMCADMLYGYQYEAAKKKCSLGLAAADKTLIADTLTRWYRARTTPSPTHDDAIDQNLATLAVMRTDDNGNDFEVKRVTNRCEAAAVVRTYEARGHKQTYWFADVVVSTDV